MNAQETCDCMNEGKPFERNGHTATCNRLTRKLLSKESQPPKKQKAITKVGKNNTFECSDGTRVTETQIKANLRLAYSAADNDEGVFSIGADGLWWTCQGCGGDALAHAHIIPKSRCKQLNKTELIWDEDNFFHACHNCNLLCENVSSIGITKLLNFNRIKAFLELHDPERHAKICYTENELHKI